MAAWVAPAIAAGASLLGGIFGNASAKKAAAKQREWEERMSNTAYQRGTEDMIKSGINPLLAISQGGASTPAGAVAQIPNKNILGDAAASYLQNMQVKSSINNTDVNSAKTITDNEIAKERLEQEKITTDNTKAKYGVHGGRSQLDDEMNILRDTAEKTRADANIRVTESRMKMIEERILEETSGSTISSAQSLARLKDKEVTGQELRNILLKLDIPEAKAMAEWWDAVGAGSPALKATMSVGQWLSFILNRRN